MKQNILFILFILLIVRACSFESYKEYNVIGKEVINVNEAKIYVECSNNKSKKRKIIDDVHLRAFPAKTPKTITVHWYEIKLNDELKYSGELGYKKEFEYTESNNPYYSMGMLKIGEFDLNSKRRDRITVVLNLTVKSEGKEETKTIEKTFVISMKKLFWLEQKLYNILSV
jgi:hypothetical protein